MKLIDYFLTNSDRPAIHKPDAYFGIYDEIFLAYQNKPVKVLEIGVENGGSLLMWRSYFGTEAEIVGIDINPKCKQIEQSGIKVYTGDQGDVNFLSGVINIEKQFDIIIDDGGHHSSSQIISFKTLYPHCKKFYVVEDTGTSYMKEYLSGGSSFVGMSKVLIDSLYNDCEFNRTTRGVYFYSNMVIFEKQIKEQKETRVIGSRMI